MEIHLTGRPGTGKTWVMKQLIKHYDCIQEGKVGLIDYVSNGMVVITGKYTGDTFEGSDKLSMAAISSVGDLIDSLTGSSIVFEGDRFTNSTMLSFNPIIINIEGDGAEGIEMRGSSQTPQRLKAMATRYNNYCYHYRVGSSDQALELVKNIIKGDVKTTHQPIDGNGQIDLF